MTIKKRYWTGLTIVGGSAALIAAFLLLLFVSPSDDPNTAAKLPAADTVPSEPQDVRELANYGYVPHADETQAFLSQLPKATLREAAPGLFQQVRADDQPVLLYQPLYAAYEEYSGGEKWVVGRQGIGDCVSWGWAHGADIHLAVMYSLGDTAKWEPAATEAIYGGSRVEARGVRYGGWSDGSYGSAAAKWVKDWGILFRRDYGDVDLSTYSSSRAKQWGNYGCGGQGDNGVLDDVAKSHPIKNVALVTTFDEAAAAISSGYPVAVCSMQGFTSHRDGDGFCRASGSWAHCQTFIGVRYDRPGLLCLNSWGPDWVDGPKWPDDQPEGSYWVDAKVADRMLSGRDSFAISGYVGFPYRDLKNADWVRAEPSKADHSFALAP